MAALLGAERKQGDLRDDCMCNRSDANIWLCVVCVCVRIESVGEELGWPDNPWYLGLHLEEQD